MKRRGFTLIELLVVISIIALCSSRSCCPPLRRSARELSQRTTCAQTSVAHHEFHGAAPSCRRQLRFLSDGSCSTKPAGTLGPASKATASLTSDLYSHVDVPVGWHQQPHGQHVDAGSIRKACPPSCLSAGNPTRPQRSSPHPSITRQQPPSTGTAAALYRRRLRLQYSFAYPWASATTTRLVGGRMPPMPRQPIASDMALKNNTGSPVSLMFPVEPKLQTPLPTNAEVARMWRSAISTWISTACPTLARTATIFLPANGGIPSAVGTLLSHRAQLECLAQRSAARPVSPMTSVSSRCPMPATPASSFQS